MFLLLRHAGRVQQGVGGREDDGFGRSSSVVGWG